MERKGRDYVLDALSRSKQKQPAKLVPNQSNLKVDKGFELIDLKHSFLFVLQLPSIFRLLDMSRARCGVLYLLAIGPQPNSAL